MKTLFFIPLFFVISLAYSQDFQPPEMRFGKGIEQDLKKETWDIVEDDAAVYLLDKIDYTYKVWGEDFALLENYHVRIKILDQEATDKGDVKLRFRHKDRYQNISNVNAASYNLVGGKVVEQKIKKKDIFKNKLNEEYTEVTFAIPDVKVGTILEYEFERTSRNTIRPGTWYFTNKYPTVYSQVSFNVPEWFKFSYYHRGSSTFVYQDAKGAHVNFGARYAKVPSTLSTWGKTNIKPIKDEDFTANINDFRDQLQFRLNQSQFPGSTIETYNTTWENLNNNLLEDDYADQQKDKKFIEDVVAEVIAGKETENEKIQALFDYVVENIELENDGWVYTSAPVKRVLKNQKGNIADANILLVNMLQTAGIEAYPMLISTRDDGYIDKLYANMRAFTYPVAYVKQGEEHLIMNASNKYRPYYLPRAMDYNLFGWVVKKDNPGWVDIEHLAPQSKRFYQINAELSTDGDYSGNVQISSDNYSSFIDRYRIDENGIVERLEQLYDGENEIKFENEESGDTENAYETFIMNADFEIEEHAQKVGDFIYFNPFIFDKMDENPFTQKDRKYPVDFIYPTTTVSLIDIKLPEGYTLEEAPQPIIVNFGDKVKLKIIIKEVDGVLKVHYEEKLMKTVFEPESYQSLQQYIDKLIEETSKQFTLKRVQ